MRYFTLCFTMALACLALTAQDVTRTAKQSPNWFRLIDGNTVNDERWTDSNDGLTGIDTGDPSVALTLKVTSAPQHGTISLRGSYVDDWQELEAKIIAGQIGGPLAPQPDNPIALYSFTQGYVGTDTATFEIRNNGTFVRSITLNITVLNTKPTLSLEASPRKLSPGGAVALIPTTSDADGHAVAVSYAYGDGLTGTEAFHTYSTPGVYTLTASANDGFDTVTTSIDIEVVGDAQRVPVPRFTTSDVVGFVGIPLAFDASFTTDPQNSIASYSWNFGDSSPAGSGQVASRTYTQEGSYLVTLTVVDGEGIQAKTARAIEILPAELLGTFNAGVEFSAVFDRTKPSKDTLSVKATLNTGDAQVGDGTAVTLAIVGQEFSALLDRKLRASVNVANAPKITIKAKAGVRKQAAGQVDLQITVKNAALGLGFNQAGVLADNDDLVEVTLPIRIDIGAKSFEVQTDAVFKFNKTGTRAKGEGQSE